MVKRIDIDRAIRLVRRGAQLIDVLPASIFAQEHLPSASNLPLDSFDDQTVTQIDLTRSIVVYCFDQH